MLPVWWSPWRGWRFRLIRYTGILYLGYAVKLAAPLQGGGGEPSSGHGGAGDVGRNMNQEERRMSGCGTP